jgi:hypothetical protein
MKKEKKTKKERIVGVRKGTKESWNDTHVHVQLPSFKNTAKRFR